MGGREGGRALRGAGQLGKGGPSSVPNCDVLQSSPKEERKEEEEEPTLKCNRGNQEVH